MLSFPRSRPGHPYFAGAPLFMAHRGGARLAPENTMEAFRAAAERWEVDILEMDVRATADGEIVVIHDPTVDRTTDGSGRVGEMTWARIRELDAGYTFVDPEGRRSFRGRGVRIPRFEEVVESFPRVRLNVDVKTPDAARGLVEIVRRHGARSRVLVAAEKERHRASVRGYEGPWGATRSQIRRFWLLERVGLSALFVSRADVLQVPEHWQGRRIVTPGFVRAAHRRNLPVHVWTVDEEDDMRRLLAWGVDGIQTDRPDRLARVLVDAAGRPPPPGSGALSGDRSGAEPPPS